MIRPRVLKVAGVLIMVFGLQFVYGLQSYAQQPDLEAAAAAKAAAGQAALSHRAIDALSPVGTGVGTFITFDVPGGVDGTIPFSINATGAVTGSYVDVNFVGHGFLRNSDGVVTTFDVPGDLYGTYPTGINGAGAITGYYCDAINCYGFLRDVNGAYVTFDAPGEVFGTEPISISSAKVITGYYYDANFLERGFVRAPNGRITSFDAPGIGTNYPGTVPAAINAEGVIALVGDGLGFLRTGVGVFTMFDAPGYISPYFDYFTARTFTNPPPLSVSAKGLIAGAYWQPISGNPFGGNYRVFVRTLNGTFTTFDAATYSPCCIWSWPSGIDPAGTVVGAFNDGYEVNHGFLRTSKGTLTTFDAPGSSLGFGKGTVPLGIDAAGEIMGYYTDASGLDHGFLLTPRP